MSTSSVELEMQVYGAIWALLLGDVDWPTLVPAGNRVRYDQVGGDQDPIKSNRDDGDYPQAMLTVTGGTDSLYTSDPTFGTHSAEGSCEWTEKFTFTFQLVLTSQLLGLDEYDALGSASRRALRRGGPRLGLDFVTDVDLRWTAARTRENSDDTAGDEQVRWKTTIDIRVAGEVNGSTQL